MDQPAYTQKAEDVLKALDAKEDGLSKSEAESRLEEHGENKLPEEKPPPWWMIFLRQFKDPLIYILIIAGLVALSIQKYESAVFIFIVLGINAIIGTVQEYGATRAAAALREMASPKAHVRREGDDQDIEAVKLVPGDIVLLSSGDKVPADIRLLESRELRIDESLLTGESQEVEKNAEEVLEEDSPLGDRVNMAYAGSAVTSGRGKGVAVATGTDTEMGRIAEDISEEARSKSPLVQRMQKFTYKIAVAILVAVAVIAAIMYWRGDAMQEIVLMSIGLAVSAIPAGLPVALTVALAIGMRRMADRNVIVRKLVAVESLGSCTMIAADKTGTLTRNELTAEKILFPDGDVYEIQAGEDMTEGEFKHA